MNKEDIAIARLFFLIVLFLIFNFILSLFSFNKELKLSIVIFELILLFSLLILGFKESISYCLRIWWKYIRGKDKNE